MKHISSRDNPLWKSLVQLCHSGRERRKQGKCVLEGEHAIRAYVERFGAPEHVIVETASAPALSDLIALAGAGRVVDADSRLFSELAQAAAPVGVLAIVPTPKPAAGARAPGRFNLVLEDIQDPGNVGTILRVAAAAGASHVFLTPGCAFAWSPKVLRAGQGAHFFVHVVEGADLVQLAGGFDGTVVAAAPRAGASVFATDLRGRVMLLVGNEGAGLSQQALDAASVRVAIPMPGGFESLNAAVAAAVCAFEKVRQDEGQ